MEVHKTISYKIKLMPPDAADVSKAFKVVNDRAAEDTARAARQSQRPSSAESAPPQSQSRRTRRPASDPIAGVAGAMQDTLSRLGSAFTRGRGGGGIGTIFTQTLRSIGLTGPQAAIGRVLAGGAMRGAIGGLGAAGGAGALAGAGPAGLIAGAVLLTFENLRGAMNHAVQSVSQFGRAFLTGDASQALHGLTSHLQSVAQLIGGPLIGGVFARFVGVGHTFINAMDGLVSSLGRWNPIVQAQQAKYNVMQQMFQMKLAGILEPIMSAWMSIKIKLLDGLSRIVDVLGSVFRAMMQFGAALIDLWKFTLKWSGITWLIDKLRQGLILVVEGARIVTVSLLRTGKALLDWVAKFDPTGAAKRMSAGINELINAVTGAGQSLGDAANNAAKSFFGITNPGITIPTQVPPRDVARMQGIQPLKVGTDALKGEKTIKPTTRPTAAGGVATASFSMTVTGAGAIAQTVTQAVKGLIVKPVFAGMTGASIVRSTNRSRWGAGSGGNALNLVEGMTLSAPPRNPWIREEAQWQADHSIRFWDPQTHQHRDPNAAKASASSSMTVTHAGATTQPAAHGSQPAKATANPTVGSAKDQQLTAMLARLRQQTDKKSHGDESGMFDTLNNLMRGSALARGF